MVEYIDRSLDHVFGALADPTRRRMVEHLASGSRSVGELAQPFASTMSLAGASKHIKVLENAAVVHRSIIGRVHRFSLNASALQAVETWMDSYKRFWNERLDALDDLIDVDGDLP